MPWEDLQKEILEDIIETGAFWAIPKHTLETAYEHNRQRNRDYMRETAPARCAARAQVRAERAAARPPCPHCGAKVERLGATAKIPTYCSKKCNRAAVFARWYAKHGVERNERRRAA